MSLQTTPDRTTPAGLPIGGASRPRVRVQGIVAGIVLVSAVAVLGGSGRPGVLAAAALVPGCVAATHDLDRRRLPDRWVVSTLAVAVAASLILAGPFGVGPLAVSAGVAGGVLLTMHLVSPDLLGFGDVKFAAALGASLGVWGSDPTQRVLLVAVMLASASGLAALAAIPGRRRGVAFGPWLVLGAAVALVFAGHRQGVVPLWQ